MLSGTGKSITVSPSTPRTIDSSVDNDGWIGAARAVWSPSLLENTALSRRESQADFCLDYAWLGHAITVRPVRGLELNIGETALRRYASAARAVR